MTGRWRVRLRRLACAALLATAALWCADRLYPPPPLALDYSTRVYDRSGALLYRFASPHSGVYRYRRADTQLPRHYTDALLAFEDRWFYHHPGVNPVALLRGLWQWQRSGEIVSGGSTITMQLARMLERIPRSVGGKLQQIARALQYEWRYSKREILAAYIDKVPMGGALEGVEAAAQHYFSLPASALTLSQSLILAGIPQNPEQLRPDRYPAGSLAQRNKLLQRYAAIRALSDAQRGRIAAEPVVLVPAQVPQAGYWTAEALRRRFPAHSEIDATIDLGLQSAVQARLDRIAYRPDEGAAVIVLDNASGEILARAGNSWRGRAGQSPWLDLTRVIRSPGSALKPFLYARALGARLVHSESLLSDVPSSFNGYRPGNFNRRFHGAVSVAEALQHSLNVPAVALLDKLGVQDFADTLTQAGLHRRQTSANLSLVLGGTGTRLIDLVGAYRSLAGAGQRIEPIESARDTAQAQAWLEPSAAWIVAAVLAEVAPPSGYRPRRQLAWKTGTSWGGRDAWAIGVSADYTTGVWIGSVRGASDANRSGYYDAGEVLFDIVTLLPADTGTFKKPAAVERANICWPAGRSAQSVAPARCEQQRRAWTIGGVAPATIDTAPNQWPDALLQWRRDKRIDQRWRGPPVIASFNDGQRIGAPRSALQLQATSEGPVDWYLNGQWLADGLLPPTIASGQHRLSAVDAAGRSSSIAFTVQ